jgi:N-glycosylase/DNA lyase
MESKQTIEGWVDLPMVPFDLQKTLESGQVFHWEIDAEVCRGLVGEEALTLRQRRGRWQVPKQSIKLAERYFSLDHPLEDIWNTFPDDQLSQAALQACRGLRIIRQPQWECLATFITSPLKQVTHIRQMSLSLRKKYGKFVSGKWAYPNTVDLTWQKNMNRKRTH